jgi:branched-chain amino acid transport system ATP-binding protein
MSEAVFSCQDMVCGYAGQSVVRGVSLDVGSGEAVFLVGPNGAGKTTLVKSIAGLLRPFSGTVQWQGRDVTGLDPRQLGQLGIVHVSEASSVFPTLTVLQNLQATAIALSRRPRSEDLERVYEIFPVLSHRRKQTAGTLSGGEQKMLAVGRALVARPALMILDEPSSGLSPRAVGELATGLGAIATSGVQMLVVEQRLDLAEGLVGRTYVLQRGVITWSGPSAGLRTTAAVVEAVLGHGIGSARDRTQNP